MYIRELTKAHCPVKAAIFDFDGTISTLRCGWEPIMEKVMLKHLRGGDMPDDQLIPMVRAYIDESTGIQTAYQMEWLANQVRELCHREPEDLWTYKDEYNEELLKMVNDRIASLENGASTFQFLVKGSVWYLRMLAEHGIEIYIASGTDDADVKREASLLGITGFVQEVKGAPYHKKDCSKEVVIRELIEARGLSGRELMVVGDGKVEIQLGAAAGAITIGMATEEWLQDGSTYNKKKLEKLQAAGADYIFLDFVQLMQMWER
ncbi:MAG: HAD family hydrolase [Firmicutes bacterium]|nr:HAD family hydrolase [Bacillota bacterium]